jgi:hypothetical protein
MLKERYVKPEVKSETLEPEALCTGGSNTRYQNKIWLKWFRNPSAGVCCDNG